MTAIRETRYVQRARVFDFIKQRGEYGATDEEVQLRTGLSGDTQRPRRIELWDKGVIRKSGRMRATSKGRAATVWVANG